MFWLASKNLPKGFIGQSLSEYSIVIVLVSISLIGAVAFLGSTIQQSMKAFHSQMQAPPSATTGEIASFPLAASNTDSSPISPASNAATSGTNGAAPVVGDFSSDTASNIETTGANGATEMLAMQIEQLTAQWLQEGKITTEEANSLAQMAKEGHKLAAHVGAYETAFVNGKSNYTFNGQEYSVKEDYSLGTNTPVIKDFLSLTPDSVATQVQPFAEVYQDAKKSGAFTNPEVANKVTQLAQEIVIITEAISSGAATASNKNNPAENAQALRKQISINFNKYAVSTIPNVASPGSAMINNNANKICNIGSNNKTGSKQCR